LVACFFAGREGSVMTVSPSLLSVDSDFTAAALAPLLFFSPK
jgi:hypothetical protein